MTAIVWRCRNVAEMF